MDILDQASYFFSLQDSNINMVLIGTLLLGIAAGTIGGLVVLSKKALIIDAISHSMLPGICIGFLLSGVKDIAILLLSGMGTSILSVWLTEYIKNKTKIKIDGAIAITLSTFFAFGVITLNLVQNSGNPNQNGLNDFLFGKAASIVSGDLPMFWTLFAIAVSCLVLLKNHFKLTLFDQTFSKTIGINPKTIQTIISFLVILAAAIGIQTVGIILISAMIIAPYSAALFWTINFEKSLVLAAIFGSLSAVIGVFISYLAPNMPTGPWVVVMLAFFTILSAVFSPKGIWVSRKQNLANKRNILRENILKTVYKLSEQNQETEAVSSVEIAGRTSGDVNKVERSLKLLKRRGLVIQGGEKWRLTEKGNEEARRIVRVHRLWELYLLKFMKLPSNYVHNSAESIEHIITPELEKLLESTMGKPEFDPHNQPIPYQK